MIDIHTILKKKTELLCKGVYIGTNLHLLESTRRGGAGPLGGRYFLFEDNKSLVNVALWDDPKKTNLSLRKCTNGFFEIYDEREKGLFTKLKLIEIPKFYDLKTTDGIEMRKIALVHGQDCLATTIYQKCRYWACGEPCKFCGLELSLNYGTTILEKTPQQISEVVTEAKKEGKCSHMTLTSGTTEEMDKGAERYINILKYLKEQHPKIPLHVQIEPIEDLLYINKLKEAGADTIGIHIEILDDFLRGIITPGKAKIPLNLYEESWKRAVEIFGNDQVATYILTGFGESSEEFIEDIDNVLSFGVIPYITPVRSIPGKITEEMPIMNHNALLEIYSRTAKKMKKFGINPLKNKAGCVRCGGCSAINEAYKAIN